MKKILQTLLLLLFSGFVFAQTDYVPGANTIFQDDFSIDPVGDFPAKWNTSGDGEVVMIDNMKWLKISQPTSISPALKKSLPEHCTIEFDIYMKSTTGVAPRIMFGLTSLSNVAVGDVYRRHISVTLEHYNESGSIVYAKNIQDLGQKKFPLEGYVERALHVSISLNGTRLRVYLDDQKVVDLPKLLTPEYRKNFFVASAAVIPSPEESIYINNVRIAGGEVDARSLLIKQLMEQGSVVTNDIQFNPQTNQITPESQPVVDQLGQVLQQNPDMNIQINNAEQTYSTQEQMSSTQNAEAGANSGVEGEFVNKAALKLKAEKIKAYLVNKFKIKKDRILTDAKAKVAKAITSTKTGKTRKLFTEIVKL